MLLASSVSVRSRHTKADPEGVGMTEAAALGRRCSRSSEGIRLSVLGLGEPEAWAPSRPLSPSTAICMGWEVAGCWWTHTAGH